MTEYEKLLAAERNGAHTMGTFDDNLKIWLAKHTEYCAETREVIADTIGIITSRPWIDESGKTGLLRKIFEASPISFDQIEYLAKRRIPPEIITYPVNIEARRFYRIYIQAHDGAGEEEIQRLAKECIKEKGLDDGDLDPEITLEEDDVEINVDWDGAMND